MNVRGYLRARLLIRFALLVLVLLIGSLLAAWLLSFSGFQLSRTNKRKALPSCLRNSFRGVVLVIVYNHPLYTSVPLLKTLYGNAFPTIVICGPKPENNNSLEEPLEEVYHKEGYFGYSCLARAMEKHSRQVQTKASSLDSPETRHVDYDGYLVINDDVMLNFWNFLRFDRTKIWEGPKVPVQYPGFVPRRKWYWWKSRWGMTQCQKAYDEIWSLGHDLNMWDKLDTSNSLEILTKNGHGEKFCYRGRSDIFYVPSQFSEIFQLLAHIFYKHGVFLEIAVPTILRMLDIENNFEQIPGVYLPGRVNESFVKDSKFFWQVYDKEKYFVHPLKLNYADSEMSRALLKTWVMEYIERITMCWRWI